MSEAHHPPPIRTDTSNDFAHHSMKVRLPNIIRETQRLNRDYPVPTVRALNSLYTALSENAPIAELELPTPDYDVWAPACASHQDHTWLNTDWFFAEMYCYRQIIQAVRWWETGRDPFAPKKAEALGGRELWRQLEQALSLQGTLEERLIGLLHASLWGNRTDLSHPIIHHREPASAADLLVDDSVTATQFLLHRPGPVHIVTDNVGAELAMDLVLSDTLLAEHADEVVLHLKMHPVLVSDAIVDDIWAFLEVLATGGIPPVATALQERLVGAISSNRLRLAPDLYWNGSRYIWDLPSRLVKTFQRARLVIFKGDANYRRLVGDRLWPPETPLADITTSFPAPLLALRTLKSDAIVGLPMGLADSLDAGDENWRVSGKRGVIQASLPSPDR
ncbi:MAG: protein-glutamate O-methyltransferase family protein [Trueperaceae bacterium]|nr:MAG: protein-glutamate O-methyltransferase family protein [Trueperaceae bacterium]